MQLLNFCSDMDEHRQVRTVLNDLSEVADDTGNVKSNHKRLCTSDSIDLCVYYRRWYVQMNF